MTTRVMSGRDMSRGISKMMLVIGEVGRASFLIIAGEPEPECMYCIHNWAFLPDCVIDRSSCRSDGQMVY